MDVNIATISYLRVLIIGIGSTIILMVVEAQGICNHYIYISHTVIARSCCFPITFLHFRNHNRGSMENGCISNMIVSFHLI